MPIKISDPLRSLGVIAIFRKMLNTNSININKGDIIIESFFNSNLPVGGELYKIRELYEEMSSDSHERINFNNYKMLYLLRTIGFEKLISFFDSVKRKQDNDSEINPWKYFYACCWNTYRQEKYRWFNNLNIREYVIGRMECTDEQLDMLENLYSKLDKEKMVKSIDLVYDESMPVYVGSDNININRHADWRKLLEYLNANN